MRSGVKCLGRIALPCALAGHAIVGVAQAPLPGPVPGASAACAPLRHLDEGASGAVSMQLRSLAATASLDPVSGRVHVDVQSTGLHGDTAAGAGAGPSERIELQPTGAGARSALVSRQGLASGHLHAEWRRHRFEALTVGDAAGGRQLVAVAIGDSDKSTSTMVGGGDFRASSWYWVQHPKARAGTPSLDVSALELLYVALLRQSPDQRFSLRTTAAWPATAHGSELASGELADVLRRIAELRECELARHPSSANAVRRWRTVHIEPVHIPRDPTASVRVRVSRDGVPLSRAPVVLNRLPHHLCNAVSDADGLAQCVLEDTHGHGALDHFSPDAPILAVYPGAIGSQTVDLPTASTLPPQPATGHARMPAPFRWSLLP